MRASLRPKQSMLLGDIETRSRRRDDAPASLAGGRTPHHVRHRRLEQFREGVAAGGMGEPQNIASRFLKGEDLVAIAAYLKRVPAKCDPAHSQPAFSNGKTTTESAPQASPHPAPNGSSMRSSTAHICSQFECDKNEYPFEIYQFYDVAPR
jgi:hypothetical protein